MQFGIGCCCPEKNIFSVKKFDAAGEVWKWQGSKPISFTPDIQACCWSGDDLICVLGNTSRPLLKFADGLKQHESDIITNISAHQTGSGEPSCIVGDRAMVTIDNGTHISLRDFNGNLIVTNAVGVYSVARHYFNHQCMWSQAGLTDTNVKAWDADGNPICDYTMGIGQAVANVSGGVLFVLGNQAIRLSDNTVIDFVSGSTEQWYGFESDKILARSTGKIYDHTATEIGELPYTFGTSNGFFATNKWGIYADGEFFGMCYSGTTIIGIGWFDSLGNELKLIDDLDFSDWFNAWNCRIPCDTRNTPNGKRYVIGLSWDEDKKARPGVTLFDDDKEIIYSHPYITPDDEFTGAYSSNFRGVTVDDNDNCYMTSTRFNFS